jgi:hypothetical protein
MYPARPFAPRYFPTRYFPKTGAVLVTTGAWALWIPLGLKGVPQAPKPGSAVVTVTSAVSAKSTSAVSALPFGSGAATVEKKGSGVK